MMEKHLPFIAAIISGVITWVATALFLQQYLALMSILLLVAIPLLRFNAWTLIGGFLTGLAIELFNRGATEQFRVAILMLIIGTGLQLAAVFLPALARGLRLPESSLGQNMLFALIGIMLFYGSQFLRCPPLIPRGPQVTLSQAYLQLTDCRTREALAHLARAEAYQEYGWESWNTLALAFLWGLLMSPMTWGAFFAALRQVNFNLLAPGRLLASTFRAFLGQLAILFILALVYVLLGILFLPFVVLADSLEIQSLPSGHPLVEAKAAISLTITIFVATLGSACGARWGEATRRASYVAIGVILFGCCFWSLLMTLVYSVSR